MKALSGIQMVLLFYSAHFAILLSILLPISVPFVTCYFLILNQESILLFSSYVKSAVSWQHLKGFMAFCLL